MTIDFNKIRKGVASDMKKYKKEAGDFDRDGVKNRKDCQPFNRKKQHVEPNIYIEEKLRKLPIFLTEERIEKMGTSLANVVNEQRYFHLLSRQARERTPRLRKEVLSMFKRSPDLMGVLRRKRPRLVLFTTKRSANRDELSGGESLAGFATERGGGIIIMYPFPSEFEETIRNVKYREFLRKPSAVVKGAVLRHEAEHIKQFRDEKLAGRRGSETTPRYFKGGYEEQSGEREARREERRFVQERSREKEQSLGKRALSGLKRIFG